MNLYIAVLRPLAMAAMGRSLAEVQSDGLSVEDDLYMRLKDLKRRPAEVETLISSPHVNHLEKMPSKSVQCGYNNNKPLMTGNSEQSNYLW